MSGSNISVYAIFKDSSAVNACIEALTANGFRNTDVSVLVPENAGTKDLLHRKQTKAPEGAAAGGGSGAILGAAAGWILGAGALAIPGLDPTITAAGPIMGMLAGMGAGLSAGGILGGVLGATMPEYEARRFNGRIRKGGILLSVHCDNSDWVKSAKNILKRSGASDISTATEAKADFLKGEKPMPRSRSRVSHQS
jgi:hypothetical protein